MRRQPETAGAAFVCLAGREPLQATLAFSRRFGDLLLLISASFEARSEVGCLLRGAPL